MKYCLVDVHKELSVLLHNETSVSIFQHLLHGCILNHQTELCFRLMDYSAQDLRNETPACYHRKSAWLPLPSLYSATSYKQARRSTGNMVSTSIMRGVQRRTKGFYRSYFMESSLRDTDWRRDRGKRVLERTADKERLWRNGTGYGITRRGDRGQRGSENMRWGGWGRREGLSSHDRRGHTYCRAHTHTGPPDTCRSLGRGQGRHLNLWSQCTGSDCCIWQ